jgi:hypothetical protein
MRNDKLNDRYTTNPNPPSPASTLGPLARTRTPTRYTRCYWSIPPSHEILHPPPPPSNRNVTKRTTKPRLFTSRPINPSGPICLDRLLHPQLLRPRDPPYHPAGTSTGRMDVCRFLCAGSCPASLPRIDWTGSRLGNGVGRARGRGGFGLCGFDCGYLHGKGDLQLWAQGGAMGSACGCRQKKDQNRLSGARAC